MYNQLYFLGWLLHLLFKRSSKYLIDLSKLLVLRLLFTDCLANQAFSVGEESGKMLLFSLYPLEYLSKQKCQAFLLTNFIM